MPINAATATAVIGGEVAKSVLEGVEDTLDRITSNISVRFRNLAEDLISQIRVSVQELWRQIADDVDRLVRDLTEQIRVQLYSLTVAANDLAKMVAEDFEDVSKEAIRELRQVISRTWFYNEIYALDEIRGTLILADVDRDWTISASGLNLGYDSEEIESLVEMVVKLPGGEERRFAGAEASSTRVEFTFPFSLIEDFRREHAITIIDAYLDIKIKKDGFLFFDKRYRGQQPFKITIAPRVAGQIDVRSEIPSFSWVRRPELDKFWSKHLPSGHATSSSKVGHHRMNHNENRIPRASVPPRPNDIRYAGASFHACRANDGRGDGCGHLHGRRASVVENGSNLHIYTYNNSHSIIAVFRGEIERYEKTGADAADHGNQPIRHGEVLRIAVPKNAGLVFIQGEDADFGAIDLVVERDPTRDDVVMPTGVFGSLRYVGGHMEGDQLVYRFSRAVPDFA